MEKLTGERNKMLKELKENIEIIQIDVDSFIQVAYGVKDKVYQKEIEYFDGILTDAELLSWTYPNSDIYELKFMIHPDQTDFWKHQNEIEYFGYLRKGNSNLSLIYPTIIHFSMCFAYGYENEVKLGKGLAFRLKLIEHKLYQKALNKKEVPNHG